MPLWEKLGTNAEFIALLESIRVATTTLNYDVVKSVVAERKAQFQAGYFDRNIARWGGFGNRVVPFAEDFNLVNSRVEKTFTKELAFQEEKFKARAEWMLDNPVTSFEFHYDGAFVIRTLFTMVPFIMLVLALYVWVVVLVLFIVDRGCDCGGDDAGGDEEKIAMIPDLTDLAGFGLQTLQMSDSKFS